MSETAITIPAPPASAPAHAVHWWHRSSGFSFHDVLDTINPLQHIPIIGSIYRSITHDEPGAVARILGDGLYGGGPIGALVGLFTGAVNVLVEADTGKDLGQHVLSWIGIGGKGSAAATAAAAGDAPPSGIPLSPSRYIMPGAASSASASGGAAAGSPSGNPAPPATSPLVQKPVPLQATGILLPSARAHPLPAAPGSTASPADLPSPAAGAAAPAAGPSSVAAAPGQPIDISEKMSEALDKYARMMQRRQNKPGPGAHIDVVQ